MKIKNIVFDVGNVLIRYDPHYIITTAFPAEPSPTKLIQAIFKHQTWYDMNLGRITEEEALLRYHLDLGISLDALRNLADIIKASLTPLPGSTDLLKQLHGQFNLFALTDNTHEIMTFLKAKYDFWPLFQGIVVSATIGHLKPSKESYEHLLRIYALQGEETLFIDDISANVEGAKKCGIHAIQFIDAIQCIEDLKKMRLIE